MDVYGQKTGFADVPRMTKTINGRSKLSNMPDNAYYNSLCIADRLQLDRSVCGWVFAIWVCPLPISIRSSSTSTRIQASLILWQATVLWCLRACCTCFRWRRKSWFGFCPRFVLFSLTLSTSKYLVVTYITPEFTLTCITGRFSRHSEWALNVVLKAHDCL